MTDRIVLEGNDPYVAPVGAHLFIEQVTFEDYFAYVILEIEKIDTTLNIENI